MSSIKSTWWKTICAALVLWAFPHAGMAQTGTVLHGFDNADGDFPAYVTLVQGRDGALYGTTEAGGTFSDGTAFRITPSGSFSVLYDFDAVPGQGSIPVAGLTLGPNGLFYGTTDSYGTVTGDGGIVFSVSSGGTLTQLTTFEIAMGEIPFQPLVLAPDGNYYGTAVEGGSGNYGTVFKVTPAGVLTVLHDFNGTDGAQPFGSLTQGATGAFYGVTDQGGANNMGTVFEITPSGAFKTLYNFAGTDGASPKGTLLLANDGNLYGTTYSGGSFGDGTVFRMTPAGVLTTLYSFAGPPDAQGPLAGLIQATDGKLYGTTYQGGTQHVGTVFSITTSGVETVLYSFNLAHGIYPGGGLVQHTNGTLYGTAALDGPYCCGTVFSLNVGLGPFVRFLLNSGKVGSTVQILGTNLIGTTSVTFNGTPASFTVLSGNFITAVVPSGATTGTVQVTTPSGTLTSNVAFRVR
jgi:uncharacterized repeat protein (TIGR03803 family)